MSLFPAPLVRCLRRAAKGDTGWFKKLKKSSPCLGIADLLSTWLEQSPKTSFTVQGKFTQMLSIARSECDLDIVAVATWASKSQRLRHTIEVTISSIWSRTPWKGSHMRFLCSMSSGYAFREMLDDLGGVFNDYFSEFRTICESLIEGIGGAWMASHVQESWLPCTLELQLHLGQ